MPVPLGATTMAGLCLHDSEAAKGDYPCSGECKEVSFHSSLLRHLERMGQGRRKADWQTYQTDQVLRFSRGISRYIIGAKGSLHAFAATKNAAATLPGRRRSHRSEQPKLFLRCFVKLFLRLHHVLMRLLDGVEFLLLLRRKQRTNLRRSAVDHSFHFLHRLLMDGGDLRFSLIEDRLNLGLLISGQVYSLGESFKRKSVPVRTATATMAGFCLHHDKAAKRDYACSRECS